MCVCVCVNVCICIYIFTYIRLNVRLIYNIKVGAPTLFYYLIRLNHIYHSL